LVGKLEGKKQRGRSRHNWEDILRWIFREWDVGLWIGSILLRIGTGGGSCEWGSEPLRYIKWG
jgi:hypothetical protein